MSSSSQQLTVFSDGPKLPASFVTQTQTVLAKRGKGKSYAAMVEAEELTKAALPWVAIDPVGVWYGLRAGRDGRKAGGLPVVVIGGDHGDLPLEPTAGAVVADFVVGERQPTVLDVSNFSQRKMVGFAADFMERLYERNRDALHFFIEECDTFCPQNPFQGEERSLGAADRIVRRGRSRGLGCSLISQRPQVVSKNLLTQTEMMVVLGFTAPQDIAAVELWFKAHGIGKEEMGRVVASLPKLSKGQAWVSSPDWLKFFGLVQVRAKETFDSSATPEAGAVTHAIRELADVPLAVLRTRMVAVEEEVKANDPKLLRQRIADLERKLGERVEPAVQRVEVPVIDPHEVTRVEQVVARIEADGTRRIEAAKALDATGRELIQAAQGFAASLRTAAAVPAMPTVPAPVRHDASLPTDEQAAADHPPQAAPGGLVAREAIPAPQRKILDAYAWWHSIGVASPSREKVAPIAGYGHPRSRGFTDPLYACRSAGLIADDQLTERGRFVAAWPTAVTSLAQYHAKLKAVLKAPAARIFDALHAGGGRMTRDALSKATGYEHVRSRGFTDPLYNLSNMGIVTFRSGEVIATDLMYPPTLVKRAVSSV
jgi:hypothetical protein